MHPGLVSIMLSDLIVGTARVFVVGCLFTPLIYFGCGFSQGHDLVHIFDFLLPMVCIGFFADALGVLMLYVSFSEAFMCQFSMEESGFPIQESGFSY